MSLFVIVEIKNDSFAENLFRLGQIRIDFEFRGRKSWSRNLPPGVFCDVDLDNLLCFEPLLIKNSLGFLLRSARVFALV